MGFLKYFSLLSLLLLAASAPAEEIPFSANDLAILFPLDPVTALPKQKISLATEGWKIFSETNFNRVLESAEKNGVFLNDKLRDTHNWYLVAMRYAPCTVFAGQASLCKEQIRFVFQPHNAIRGRGFDDYAMHVIFNFDTGLAPVASQRLESFRALKNEFGSAVANKTLKPNPVLASDKGDAYLAKIQKEIIEKHISARSASIATFMGLARATEFTGEDPHDWRFFAGEIGTDGLWENKNLPTGHGVLFESFRFSDEGETIFSIQPLKGQRHLMNTNIDNTVTATEILDMRKTNDHNVDCASCHFADIQLFQPVMEDTPAKRNTFMSALNNLIKDNPRLTEVVINNDIHVGQKPSEMPIPRIFGYLDADALISQRMVIDNAISVENANKLLNLKVVPQCQGASRRESFMKCLYFGEFGATVTQCLQKSCF